MSKWIIKAVVQKFISFLPFKHRINFLFQKYVTRGVQLSDEYFDDRLIHLGKHYSFYQAYRAKELEATKVLELGTGWYPTIPIGLFLAGFGKMYTIDISNLLEVEGVKEVIERYISYADKGLLAFPVQTGRLEALRQLAQTTENLSLEALLAKMNITYIVGDARRMNLEDNSIDFITSNNTFEHVYPQILEDILAEFKRVNSADGGVMSHFIDMSDHFAHFDKEITIYNFLKFSETQWNLIDNTIQPQNRWRINQYQKLYEKLEIPIVKEDHRAGRIEEVKALSLHEDFQKLPIEVVAVSHGYIVSKFSQN
jgi:hypothetical protein